VAGHDVLPILEEHRNQRNPEVIGKAAQLMGISESESAKVLAAVKRFTQTDYDEIRALQYQGKTSADIESINTYLERMPKYQGEIHRGKGFKSDEDRAKFIERIVTEGYTLPAMSSFSSNVTVAQSYSGGEAASGILITVRNKSGVSVKALSQMQGEDEVLVPKGAKYKLIEQRVSSMKRPTLIVNNNEIDKIIEIILEEV